MSARVELIADDHNLCGEGPLWSPATRTLLWTDILSSKTYEYDPAGGSKRILIDDLQATGLALRETGGLVIANRKGLYLWDGPGRWHTVATEHEGEQLVFNDILADPHGRLYAGTLYWGIGGMIKTGRLYLFNTDGSIRVVADDILLANGLGLSLDNRTLYFADSAARRILAFDVAAETGLLSNRRTFVRVPDGEGMPDGLTVDSAGFIWSAQWFGGQVVRYDPEGRVERRIPIPAKQVSSLTFAGPDLADLYITTAADYSPSPLEPAGFDRTAFMGGPLYRIRLDIAGRPEFPARLSIR